MTIQRLLVKLLLRSLPAASFLCVALLVAGPSRAEIVPPGAAPPAEAREVLEQVATAILDGDHLALTALIHPDGVRLSLGPDPERINELTAAQAHYYFKNLFQTQRTVGFDYLRRQLGDQDRVFATAVWRSSRAATGEALVTRIVVTLIHHELGWRVSELATLRGG